MLLRLRPASCDLRRSSLRLIRLPSFWLRKRIATYSRNLLSLLRIHQCQRGKYMATYRGVTNASRSFAMYAGTTTRL
jgi:hypothetical protein